MGVQGRIKRARAVAGDSEESLQTPITLICVLRMWDVGCGLESQKFRDTLIFCVELVYIQ